MAARYRAEPDERSGHLFRVAEVVRGSVRGTRQLVEITRYRLYAYYLRPKRRGLVVIQLQRVGFRSNL